MKKVSLLLVVVLFFTVNGLLAQSDNTVKKSIVLFTQKSSATPFNYEKFKADGVFWGHMIYNGIESDAAMNSWAADVENRVSNGEYFFGRLEFDWGWKWMIDFMDDPGSYWAQDLNGNNIIWTGTVHNGHAHSWQSHHGPEFLEWLKFQVDRIDLAPITHLMIDSQTSASRTLHWLGGDFSVHSMNNFREYLKEKYTLAQLSEREIDDIDNFNYRAFLIGKGFTLSSYKREALSIDGDIPLYEDFVYFQRQALNDVMDELFEYIDTKKPGIAIGATTNVVEPRGYIFSDRQSYIAGEFFHAHDPAKSPPFKPLLHYKAAEALDKTLIYFPYPDAFRALYDRNSPRQARGWIAQAYAMGSVFTIPGNIWLGAGYPTWDPGWEVYSDLYAFVHDHAELLDDYSAVSNVALAYSVYGSLLESHMDGSITARQTLEYLIEENISFDLKIFGDPDRPIAPTIEELGEYEAIVHDSDIQYFTAEQNQILDANASNVVSIDNPTDITKLLSWKINVLKEGKESNDLISALPRISSDEESPYVLHLINRKYNSAEDKAETHNSISVRIPKVMFQNTIIEAKLHTPGKPSVDLSFETNNTPFLTLNLDTFDEFWGIIELGHDSTPSDHNYVLSNEGEEFETEKISLYPNPANEYINIIGKGVNNISSIEIYNVQGKLVINKQVDSNSIDISSLNKGVYMVRINDNTGKIRTEKLIKN
ncbi:MAG: T9SS type A sorting domain-containing protein [Cyclobacteriaceae bacterium]